MVIISCFPKAIRVFFSLAVLLISGCASIGGGTTADSKPAVEGYSLWPTTLELDPTIVDPLGQHPLLSMFRPSNDRDWAPEQAVLPYVEFLGDKVLVHNIRCAKYHAEDDIEVNYYDKTFDLSEIKNVDFLVCPFASAPGMAHTMLSFGFEGEEYVAVSVEIRKEKGESYDPLKGLLHQYEIMYVVADERDLIQLRTNIWQNEVFLYRTKATPKAARELFVDVAARINKLRLSPEFYDTLTNNCTTNIAQHVNRLYPERVPMDYRVLLSGYSDRMAYELGLLDSEVGFEETRARARVNYLAYLHRNDADFSAQIRRR